jgi:hypothetical protein
LRKTETKDKDLLLGEQVVLKMAEKYNHVYFNNFFSSVKVMKFRLENKIYACGTARLGRKKMGPVN